MMLQPCFLVVCVSTICDTYLGLGQYIIHVHTVSIKFWIAPLILEIFYNSALFLIKLSVLLFYVRISRTVGIYRTIFWVVGLTLIAWWIGVNSIAILPCHPVRKAWDPSVPGHCLDQKTNFVATAISNIVTELSYCYCQYRYSGVCTPVYGAGFTWLEFLRLDTCRLTIGEYDPA